MKNRLNRRNLLIQLRAGQPYVLCNLNLCGTTEKSLRVPIYSCFDQQIYIYKVFSSKTPLSREKKKKNLKKSGSLLTQTTHCILQCRDAFRPKLDKSTVL